MIHVALVEPEIPGNTGNVGRSCLAAGARLHLVRPLGFSLDDRQVRRAGLDYWRHVRPVMHDNLAAFEAALSGLGTPLVMTKEAPRRLWDAPIPDDVVFVFGRESVGLPHDLRRRYQPHLVALPILSDHVRSLNLSNAVAIALYEALRRRLGAPT